MNTKYIVWVGGVDDHYDNFADAYSALQEWYDYGYDVVLIEVEEGE